MLEKIKGWFAPDVDVSRTKLQAILPLPVGTLVRSTRDTVPNIEYLDGYMGLLATVEYDPDHGTGDGEWAIVEFEDDPYIEEARAMDIEVIRWAWPRTDFEVVQTGPGIPGSL